MRLRLSRTVGHLPVLASSLMTPHLPGGACGDGIAVESSGLSSVRTGPQAPSIPATIASPPGSEDNNKGEGNEKRMRVRMRMKTTT